MNKSIAALSTALDHLGIPRAILAGRRRHLWPGAGLTVAVYHRVVDPADIGDLDPALIDATPAEFDQQMAYLRRNFQPVGIDEVLAAYRGGPTLPPDSVLVTFDDGYRDNHDQALPILKRHGIKALFFISTGHVTDRRLFWWERISFLLKRSTKKIVHIDYPAPETLNLGDDAGQRHAFRRLNRIVKDHFGLDLDRFLDEIAAACGVAWTPTIDRDLANRVLMTWDDVRALHAAGMGIGSHARNHRVLQTLPAAEIDAELRESRAMLEREIGKPVTTIAYPVGKRISYLPLVRQALAAAGYELGFTSTPGTNPIGSVDDRFDLKRLTIDRGIPTGLAHFRLAMPFLVRVK